MAIDVRITNGLGSGSIGHVTHRGELVTNRADYSVPYTAEATVINTGYNYSSLSGSCICPLAGKQFVITEILISADRNVGGTSGALINIYEADSDTSTVPTKNIVKDIEIVKNERLFMNLNMIITQGKWVNIKTDDNNIRSTIWGYYVNA
jgi:hypothetical protein